MNANDHLSTPSADEKIATPRCDAVAENLHPGDSMYSYEYVPASFARQLERELASLSQAHEKEREEISTLKEMVYERSNEIEQLHGMVDAWRTRAEAHRRSAETSGATLDALSATLAERDRALELLNEQNNDWGKQAVKQQQRHEAQLSTLQSERDREIERLKELLNSQSCDLLKSELAETKSELQQTETNYQQACQDVQTLQSELATVHNLLKERAELISEWQDIAHKAFAKVGEQEKELYATRFQLITAQKQLEADKYKREMWENIIKGWTDLCQDRDSLRSQLQAAREDNERLSAEILATQRFLSEKNSKLEAAKEEISRLKGEQK